VISHLFRFQNFRSDINSNTQPDTDRDTIANCFAYSIARRPKQPGRNGSFAGNYDQALHDFQTAMSSTQDAETQAEAMLGIGRVDYLTGNWQGAVQVLNTLVQTYQETQARVKAYYFLGPKLYAA